MTQRAPVWTSARFAAFVLASGAAASSPVAAAVPGSALTWMLSSPTTTRSCQLSLRFDSEGAAGGLTVPAACRHAIPAVRMALSWSMNAEGGITFASAEGQPLVAFDRQADGTWRANGAGGTTLVLTPVGSSAEAIGSMPGTDGPVALSTTPLDATSGTIIELADNTKPARAAAAADQANAKDIAGRYAVMRGDRDTGCMVTLDTEGRGAKSGFRARLAPACRDQGIIVFDPIGWQAKGGTLKLTARKGHSIDLTRDANGTFTKMPPDAKALGLKRL